MRLALHFFTALLLLASPLPAHAGQVELLAGKETVKVLIDHEVFTVFYHGKKYAKPFWFPVAAPNGFKFLAENLLRSEPASPHEPGMRVIVVSEQAPVTKAPGLSDEILRSVSFRDILEVASLQKNHLELKDGGWIASTDVVPLAAVVTRLINDNPSKTSDHKAPEYYDHVHHKGVWTAIDEVNDLKFWAEQARIENLSVKILSTGGESASLEITNAWQGFDGKPLLTELTTVSVFPNRLMVFDIRFTGGDRDVTFHDTKEGLFGIRIPNSMRENVGGGTIVNADGKTGSANCWGRQSPWVDYSGNIGGRTLGVTLFDHPNNFRPSRYHVRDYGLFTISPFGNAAYTQASDAPLPAAPVHLTPGATVSLRYGLYVHNGDHVQGSVPDTARQFLTLPRLSNNAASKK